MKIAIAQTKGGCGKTTTAAYLALAAAQRGYRVEAWDADSQGSLSDWSMAADEVGETLPFQVLPANAATIRKPSHADFVFIDTPPGDPAVIQAAIDASDLVIVPTNAAPMDVQRVWQTLEASDHKRTAVLVVAAELNTTLLRDTIDALSSEGVFVCKSVIPKRQQIRKAFGSRPEKLHGYDDVLSELLEATND
ncbi:AAA family ATPase [Corynebacterium sp. 22_2729]|uniref:AAA family ATPase n=1 Tax=Corynebacterium macclintockiae TaxID=2913501 RepID=UPI003EBFD709